MSEENKPVIRRIGSRRVTDGPKPTGEQPSTGSKASGPLARSEDDTDLGWSSATDTAPEGADSNDVRLLDDVPPHWGRS